MPAIASSAVVLLSMKTIQGSESYRLLKVETQTYIPIIEYLQKFV